MLHLHYSDQLSSKTPFIWPSDHGDRHVRELAQMILNFAGLYPLAAKLDLGVLSANEAV